MLIEAYPSMFWDKVHKIFIIRRKMFRYKLYRVEKASDILFLIGKELVRLAQHLKKFRRVET